MVPLVYLFNQRHLDSVVMFHCSIRVAFFIIPDVVLCNPWPHGSTTMSSPLSFSAVFFLILPAFLYFTFLCAADTVSFECLHVGRVFLMCVVLFIYLHRLRNRFVINTNITYLSKRVSEIALQSFIFPRMMRKYTK